MYFVESVTSRLVASVALEAISAGGMTATGWGAGGDFWTEEVWAFPADTAGEGFLAGGSWA